MSSAKKQLNNQSQKSLKIAIDIRNIGRNRTGSEVVILQLVKYLLRIDTFNQYKLLTDTDDSEVLDYINEHLELADKKNYEIISLQAKNKFIWSSWTIWRWVRKNPVDIYHTEYILPFFMPKSIKLISHIHDVSFRVYRELISWRDIYFLDIFIPWSLKKADLIIAVSQFTKDEIEKYYPASRGKVELVYNAVADDFADDVFSHSQSSLAQYNQVKIQKIKKKYDLPKKYILALGTMQPRKNIPFLIASYEKIYKKLDNIKLVLVGKKAHNFDFEIEKVIEKSDSDFRKNIIFTGYVDENDKALVFAGAEVFAFPSLYEGFGIPPLEAVHTRTPVVISDIQIHREIFAGVVKFFDPQDIDQCAKVLYSMASNEVEKEKFAQQALMLKNKFSYKSSAEQMVKLMEKLV